MPRAAPLQLRCSNLVALPAQLLRTRLPARARTGRPQPRRLTALVPRPSLLCCAGSRVYVHNLPWSITEATLESHMSSAGAVESVTIMRYNNGRSKVSSPGERRALQRSIRALAAGSRSRSLAGGPA